MRPVSVLVLNYLWRLGGGSSETQLIPHTLVTKHWQNLELSLHQIWPAPTHKHSNSLTKDHLFLPPKKRHSNVHSSTGWWDNNDWLHLMTMSIGTWSIWRRLATSFQRTHRHCSKEGNRSGTALQLPPSLSLCPAIKNTKSSLIFSPANHQSANPGLWHFAQQSRTCRYWTVAQFLVHLCTLPW